MSAKPDVPTVGSYVVDLKGNRVAEVMDYRTGVLYLRLPGGGAEFTRTLTQVRQTAPEDDMGAWQTRLSTIAAQCTDIAAWLVR